MSSEERYFQIYLALVRLHPTLRKSKIETVRKQEGDDSARALEQLREAKLAEIEQQHGREAKKRVAELLDEKEFATYESVAQHSPDKHDEVLLGVEEVSGLEFRKRIEERLERDRKDPSKESERQIHFRFDGLHVEKLLGSGGMGLVFEHPADRTRVIKFINTRNPAPKAIERFKREFDVLWSLKDHPRVVQVYEYRESEPQAEGSVPCFVMERLSGTLKERSDLSLQEIELVVEQISDALMALHTANYVHRDVKPQNIMFNQERQVKLVDFGIVLDETQDTTADAHAPGYNAPEVPKTARSDIYSLGVILAELLIPHKASSEPLYFYLDAISQRCIRHTQADRYESALKLHDVLVKVRHGSVVDSRGNLIETQLGERVPAGSFWTSRRAATWAVALLLLVILVLNAWMLIVLHRAALRLDAIERRLPTSTGS